MKCINPLTPRRTQVLTMNRYINSILRRDHQNNFLWASRLWVGRRKEPILGYVPKNNEKKNLVHKGLKNTLVLPFLRWKVWRYEHPLIEYQSWLWDAIKRIIMHKLHSYEITFVWNYIPIKYYIPIKITFLYKLIFDKKSHSYKNKHSYVNYFSIQNRIPIEITFS